MSLKLQKYREVQKTIHRFFIDMSAYRMLKSCVQCSTVPHLSRLSFHNRPCPGDLSPLIITTTKYLPTIFPLKHSLGVGATIPEGHLASLGMLPN